MKLHEPCPACDEAIEQGCREFAEDVAAGKYNHRGYTEREWVMKRTQAVPRKAQEMTDADVIAAIRAHHLKANIAEHEADGTADWDRAWIDRGGTMFGAGPYLKVPIRGGAWDGAVQRVYAPARLQRRLVKLWTRAGRPAEGEPRR